MHRVHVTSIVKSKYSKSCYWNNPVNVIIFCCTKSILLTGFHCISMANAMSIFSQKNQSVKSSALKALYGKVPGDNFTICQSSYDEFTYWRNGIFRILTKFDTDENKAIYSTCHCVPSNMCRLILSFWKSVQ